MQLRLKAQRDASIQEYQQDLWNRADRVFLARVAIAEPPPAPPPPRYDPRSGKPPRFVKPPAPIPFNPEYYKTDLLLTAVAGLKGATPAKPFEIVQSYSWSMCGGIHRLEGSLAYFDGGLQEGAVVVVFATGPYPTPAGLLGVLKPDEILAPDLKAALAETTR